MRAGNLNEFASPSCTVTGSLSRQGTKSVELYVPKRKDSLGSDSDSDADSGADDDAAPFSPSSGFLSPVQSTARQSISSLRGGPAIPSQVGQVTNTTGGHAGGLGGKGTTSSRTSITSVAASEARGSPSPASRPSLAGLGGNLKDTGSGSATASASASGGAVALPHLVVNTATAAHRDSIGSSSLKFASPAAATATPVLPTASPAPSVKSSAKTPMAGVMVPANQAASGTGSPTLSVLKSVDGVVSKSKGKPKPPAEDSKERLLERWRSWTSERAMSETGSSSPTPAVASGGAVASMTGPMARKRAAMTLTKRYPQPVGSYRPSVVRHILLFWIAAARPSSIPGKRQL